MSKSKADIIEERKSNLPLPDDPPQGKGFKTADASGTNVGSGKFDDNPDIPGDLSSVGRQGKDNLPGLPNDAVTRGAKHKPGLADTTNDNAPAQ